jgi:hypothetical protein
MYNIERTGDNAEIWQSWIGGGVQRYTGINRNFNGANILYGWATSIHYDLIIISNVAITFYSINFSNPNSPTFD